MRGGGTIVPRSLFLGAAVEPRAHPLLSHFGCRKCLNVLALFITFTFQMSIMFECPSSFCYFRISDVENYRMSELFSPFVILQMSKTFECLSFFHYSRISDVENY